MTLKKYTSPFKIVKSLKNVPIGTNNTFLIYDRRLESLKTFSQFRKRFQGHYAVRAGETLKDLAQFPEHVAKISKALSRQRISQPIIYIFGGGSVGDFAAFFCSVYKRGVPFVHIASTYLAALDSAHGAKNALNLQGVKNQIGSFWPAKNVYIVEAVLNNLPEKIARESYSELFKAALLKREDAWARRLLALPNVSSHSELIRKNLKKAIQVKNEIVQKDPFELKQIRHQLNLGHSLGHVFESALELSHGESVAWGLRFTMDYSFFVKKLSSSDHAELLGVWLKHFEYAKQSKEKIEGLSGQKVKRLLLKDKKNKSLGINFVYLSSQGAQVKLTSIQDVLGFWPVWKSVI